VTIGDWLAARAPAPPPELLARLSDCLGPAIGRPVGELSECAVETAEALLTGMLARGDTSRATALDLLVVDSLVTYAFEAAARDPETIGARARATMHRLSALGRIA
jgi:hypothetical protein